MIITTQEANSFDEETEYGQTLAQQVPTNLMTGEDGESLKFLGHPKSLGCQVSDTAGRCQPNVQFHWGDWTEMSKSAVSEEAILSLPPHFLQLRVTYNDYIPSYPSSTLQPLHVLVGN
jgi:hypothetical protein